jgi:hypothetical protein
VRIVVGHNAAASIDNELQQAFAAGAPQVPNEAVPCSDREAVELLLVGRADFGLIGGSLSPRETQAGMSQVRLGVELFAVSASPRSSVRSLTRAQLRQIFTAEVTTWQQFGLDGGDIVAIVPADRALADRAARAAEAFAATAIERLGDIAQELGLGAPRVHRGLIASGDQFFASTEAIEALRADLPDVLCVEMEGAAVAQVCHEYGAPVCVIRTISDTADHAAHLDFPRFLSRVCGVYARALVEGTLR